MKEVDAELTLLDSSGRSVSSTTQTRMGFEIESDLHWNLITLYFGDDATVVVNLAEITAMYLPHPMFETVTATHLRVRVGYSVKEVPLSTPETFCSPGLYTFTGAVTIKESIHEDLY